jgi:hypothetical protein
VIANLDIFAQAGKDHALDMTFDSVAVTNGWLAIEFSPRVEYACVSALVVESASFVQKINCGGPAYKDYAADSPPTSSLSDLPQDDFYRDWAQAEFGPAAAEAGAAALFSSLDGRLPRPTGYYYGPGDILPDARNWEAVRPQYDFVDRLAALAPLVKGPGYRARFDWWLSQFRCLRAVGHVACQWSRYCTATYDINAEPDSARKIQMARTNALPIRIAMAGTIEEALTNLLLTVKSSGELGTAANWNQKIIQQLLVVPGAKLAAILGQELPPEAKLRRDYIGPTRVIVPAVRGCAAWNEDLNLKVIVLAEQRPREAAVFWRTLGEGAFVSAPLVPVARGVYSALIPAGERPGSDLEYYLKIDSAAGDSVYFPPTAPSLNQTVVRVETAFNSRLTAFRRQSPDQWQIELKGIPQNRYLVQFTTNLTRWMPVVTNRTDAAGDLSVSVPVDTNSAARFYRSRKL